MLSSNRGSGVSLLASRGRSGKKTPRARRRRTNRGRRRPTTTSNPTDDDRRLANANSGTVIPPISATLRRPEGREGRPLSTRHATIRLRRRSIDLFAWETKDRDSSAVFEVAVVAGKPTVTGFSDWDGPRRCHWAVKLERNGGLQISPGSLSRCLGTAGRFRRRERQNEPASADLKHCCDSKACNPGTVAAHEPPCHSSV